MEVACSSETSANFSYTTECPIFIATVVSASNPAKSQLTTGADPSSGHDSRSDVEDVLRLFMDTGDVQPRSQGLALILSSDLGPSVSSGPLPSDF
jgi:hypothetical protein